MSFEQYGIPVAPLARDVVLDGDACPFLDRVARDHARVVRGAAGDDDDAPEVPDLLIVEAEAVELKPPVPDAVADRLFDCVRLLVDLLQHERLEPALLRRFLVPVDLLHRTLHERSVSGREGRAVGSDGDDLVVLDELHLPRVAEEGRGHRGEEHLAVAHANEERALVTSPDEQPLMRTVCDDEGEVAFELPVGGADSLGEIACVVALDEVRDHLCVRLRREAMPLLFERRLQLAVVLDDPVQDQGHLAVLATRQRVRVLLADAPVRGPACVPDPGRCVGGDRRRRILEELEVADRTDVLESVVRQQREARRVVAAVLEPLEAVEKERLTRARPDVSDDPAHLRPLSDYCPFSGKIPPREAQRARPSPHPASSAVSRAPCRRARRW